jgi:hypothetical protein
MKKYLALLIFALTIIACVPAGTKATWPKGSKLCRTNWDCAHGQYCGFVPGYTAAVCR